MTKTDELRKMADECSQARRYDDAIALREQIVKRMKTDLERGNALGYLARDLECAGRVERAVHAIQDQIASYLEREPGWAAGAHLEAARMLQRAGRLDEAMGFVRGGVALLSQTDDRRTRYNVLFDAGEIAKSHGEFNQAIDYYEYALPELDGDPILVHDGLIDCNFALDRFDVGMAWLAEQIKGYPGDWSLARKALAARRKHDLEAASRLFKQAHQQMKKQARSWDSRIKLLKRAFDASLRELKTTARAAAPPRPRAATARKKAPPNHPKAKGRR